MATVVPNLYESKIAMKRLPSLRRKSGIMKSGGPFGNSRDVEHLRSARVSPS